MSVNNPSPVEKYRQQKEDERKRAQPHRTPDRDRNQFTLSGERIHAGTIRARRKALDDGRFIP